MWKFDACGVKRTLNPIVVITFSHEPRRNRNADLGDKKEINVFQTESITLGQIETISIEVYPGNWVDTKSV